MNNRKIWLNGDIVDVNDAKISVLSPSFQYAVNVFEGIRCYWNEEENQLFAFRLHDHYKRLKKSQLLLQIENKYSENDLKKALLDIVKANKYKEDILVRQTIFVDGFGSWASKEEAGMFVSPIPKKRTNTEYNKKSLHCCISTWQRINENMLSPRIKCGANYINSRMAQLEAIKNGYDATILLNAEGKVSESTGSCLFIVKEGKLITPLFTDGVLESITRDTIIKIAKEELNISVIERTIDRTELYTCDEAFLCGTAMEITPISSIDKFSIKEKEITNEINNCYLDIVKGKKRKYNSWLTPIYGDDEI